MLKMFIGIGDKNGNKQNKYAISYYEIRFMVQNLTRYSLEMEDLNLFNELKSVVNAGKLFQMLRTLLDKNFNCTSELASLVEKRQA